MTAWHACAPPAILMTIHPHHLRWSYLPILCLFPFSLIEFFNCGYAGADIRSVCTEAGMFAIRSRRKTVTEKDFLDAVNKVIKGYQKFSATPKYMVYNWGRCFCFETYGCVSCEAGVFAIKASSKTLTEKDILDSFTLRSLRSIRCVPRDSVYSWGKCCAWQHMGVFHVGILLIYFNWFFLFHISPDPRATFLEFSSIEINNRINGTRISYTLDSK